MKWSEHITFANFSDYCLIMNHLNSQCFKISYECLSYINKAISIGLSQQQLIESCVFEEDKLYIETLLNKLEEFLMLSDSFEQISSSNMNITWNITNRCNLHCKHCCISADNFKNHDLGSEKLLSIANKITSLQPRAIIISGGEPMVNNMFFDIIKEIRKSFCGNLILMTNGTLINSTNAFFIREHFNAIDISLDGYDSLSCSEIRGEGVYNKVLKSVSILQDIGFTKISLSMVVTKQNIAHKDIFIQLCDNLGVKYIFRKFENIGRGKINEEDLMPYDMLFYNTCNLKKPTKSISPVAFSCKATLTEFMINSVGGIYPCPLLFDKEFELGNILIISDLKGYLEQKQFKHTKGYETFLSYHPHNLLHCRNCNFRGICHSCVAQIKNNIINDDFNKNCEIMKKSFDLYFG